MDGEPNVFKGLDGLLLHLIGPLLRVGERDEVIHVLNMHPRESGGHTTPSWSRCAGSIPADLSTILSWTAWQKASAWAQPIGSAARRGRTFAEAASGRPSRVRTPSRPAVRGGRAKYGRSSNGSCMW